LTFCLSTRAEEYQFRQDALTEMAALGAPAVPALIAELRSDEEDRAGWAAAALATIGPAAAEACEALFDRYLLACRQHEDALVMDIGDAFERIGKACLPCVKRRAAKFGQDDEFYDALFMLEDVQADDRESFDILLKALRDYNAEPALYVIGKYPAFRDEAFNAVVETIERGQFKVFATMELANFLEFPERLNQLLPVLLDDPDVAVREAAAEIEQQLQTGRWD
jgi:hypothetical protein